MAKKHTFASLVEEERKKNSSYILEYVKEAAIPQHILTNLKKLTKKLNLFYFLKIQFLNYTIYGVGHPYIPQTAVLARCYWALDTKVAEEQQEYLKRHSDQIEAEIISRAKQEIAEYDIVAVS